MSQKLKGNGNIINQEIATLPFNKINIEGNFSIFLFEGLNTNFIIETDENIIPQISYSVIDSTLIISTKNKIKSSTVLNLFLSLSDLQEITCKGRSNATFYSYITEKLKITMIDEDSELEIKISNNNLQCDIYGFGFVEINGMYNNLKINAYEETTITLDVICKYLICNMYANSFGSFYGTTELLSITMFDEAYLKAFNLLSKNCYIDINDISEGQINVSDKLHVSGLNDGFLQYKGNPYVELMDLNKGVFIRSKKEKSTLLTEN